MSKNESVSWSWIKYSFVVSLASMLLIAIAIGLSSKWSFIPVSGLIILIYFLLHSPVSRYFRLSIIVIGIWGGVFIQSSTQVKVVLEEYGWVTIELGEARFIVHFLFLVLTMFLLGLDFKSREKISPHPEDLTKNRLTLYKLYFFAYLATLIFIGVTSFVAISLIPSIIKPPKDEQETVSNLKKSQNDTDYKIEVTDSLWPQGHNLKIYFLDGDKDSINFVKKVAKEWLQYVNITYEYTENIKESDIRITLQSGKGFDWAYIGTKALDILKDEATIGLDGVNILNTVDEKRRSVLHEFGHVLGLNHEHQTPNALQQILWNKAYKYYGNEMKWNRNDVDNNMRNISISTKQYYNKPYDSASVMGYALPSEILKTPIHYYIRGTLSEVDIQFISKLYPIK